MAQRHGRQLRRYLRDSTAPVPRTTLWRHRKKAAQLAHTPQPDPPHPLSSTLASPLPSTGPPLVDRGSPTYTPGTPPSDPGSPPSDPGSSPSDPGSPPSSPPSDPGSSPYYPGSPPSSPPSDPGSPPSDPGSPPFYPGSPPSSPPSDPGSPPYYPGSPPSDPGSPPSNPGSPSDSDLEHSDSDSLPSSNILLSVESHPKLFRPLYPGATVTLCGALCAIMHFSSKHKLSYSAIGGLLGLLLLLCPTPCNLPSSFYRFQKFFRHFQGRKTHTRVCLDCVTEVHDCKCPPPRTTPAHLIGISIVKQLQSILFHNWEKLRQPFSRQDTWIRDVWDGSVLRQHSEGDGFFSRKENLALSLNTDGVPLFKSSSWSLWPVFLTIFNLPPAIRMKAENVLLCGLWYGPTKPLMSDLLGPLLRNIRQHAVSGISVMSSAGLSTVRAKIVVGIFDLPAKAAVLCMKQFNGEYGCAVCIHPGKRLANGARVYLPQKHTERTHQRVMNAARVAQQDNRVVEGVKAVSPLAPYVDLVLSVPVDYMHAVLEGVVRMLMKCWFEPSHHREPQYLGRAARTVDAQLLRQRPPLEFSHPPRSIRKHLKYWKASELRNWLLYYSLPILLHVLPSLFWHHYALLVCAIHILLRDKLTATEIDAAEQMLADFYSLLPELYGERCCTANAHLLSHLAKYVRLWGPLWTHSSFGYESKNGHIKQFIHNKSDVVRQLLFNVDVSITLQHIYPILRDTETHETLHYLSAVGHTVLRKNMYEMQAHTYAVGKRFLTTLAGSEADALGLEPGTTVQAFSRLYKDGVLYHSEAYSRSKGKRNNTICVFMEPHRNCLCFGLLKLFISHPEQAALVTQLDTNGRSLMQLVGPPCREVLQIHKDIDLLHCHIKPISGYCELQAVPLPNIVGKAVLLYGTDCEYVALQPNPYEMH